MIARLVALALAVTVLVGVAVVIGDDGYIVRAELPGADGLREDSLVRVGGVTVGTVGDLRVTADDTVRAELRLDDDVAPIGRDAALRIRAANLLGEKYLDLDVGDRAQPIDPRTGIPRDRVGTSVELDDVIDVLDPTTRTRFGILLREAGIAMGGNADELAATLRRMPPAMDDVRRLFGEAAADTRVLRGLVRRSDRLLAAVAREREDLGALVTTGADVLATTARRRRDLGATLRELPPSLRQLRTTLGELDVAGAALRPAARGLAATAPALTTTLEALPGFTRAARPALRTARAVAPDLGRLGREVAPVVRRLRPAAETLAGAAQDSDPLTEALDLGAADLLGTMENWARAIQQRDGVSHQFRVSASVDPAVVGALREYVVGPTRRRSGPRPAADAPGGKKAPPSPGPAAPKPAGPRRPLLTPRPLPDLPAAVDDVVTATDETLTALLDHLLAP